MQSASSDIAQAEHNRGLANVHNQDACMSSENCNLMTRMNIIRGVRVARHHFCPHSRRLQAPILTSRGPPSSPNLHVLFTRLLYPISLRRWPVCGSRGLPPPSCLPWRGTGGTTRRWSPPQSPSRASHSAPPDDGAQPVQFNSLKSHTQLEAHYHQHLDSLPHSPTHSFAQS